MKQKTVVNWSTIGWSAALVAAIVSAPAAAVAQDPTAPLTIRVTQVKVKPGYNSVWRANQRDIVVPYAEAAGWPFLSTYRVRFGSANFAVVSPIGTYDITGQPPDEDALDQFRKALRDSVDESSSYVQRKHPDLSFGEPTEEPWPHISVSHITLAPGMRGKFIQNFKQNGIPRWKEMGLPALVTWEIIYGQNSGQFVVVVPIENYAELAEGTPFYRGMSEADRAAILSGMQGVIANIQRVIADYLPAESYMPGE